MKASTVQRVLLYALLLPLALLTCVWYLLQVIGSFDASAASAIAQSGLGPIGLNRGGSAGLSTPGGGGGGGVARVLTTITTTGVRTAYGTYEVATSDYSLTRVPTETVTRTRFAGYTDFYTYHDLQTTWFPTTRTRYGYMTTTGVYTTTTFGGWSTHGYKRALPTPSRQEAGEAAPTPAPTPVAPVLKARSVASQPKRHELVKRRRGGGGGGGGGGGAGVDEDAVIAAFLNHIPNFLGLFWSFAVLLWLLILPCQNPASPSRSIAGTLKALLWFWIIGLISTLYTTIVIGVAVNMMGALLWGLWVVIVVFAWALLLALFGTWLWLKLWARSNALGQYYRSVEAAEAAWPAPGPVEQKWDAQSTPASLPYQQAYPVPPLPGQEQYFSQQSVPPAGQEQYQQAPGQYGTPPPASGSAQDYYGQLGQVGTPPPGPAPAGFTYALVPVASASASAQSPPRSPPPVPSPPHQPLAPQPQYPQPPGQGAPKPHAQRQYGTSPVQP